MSEENTAKTASTSRLKSFAAAVAVRLRQYLTPELGKRAAVCLFMLALLFCDLGVCLGASIIFVLVRAFRFENGAYDRSAVASSPSSAVLTTRQRGSLE